MIWLDNTKIAAIVAVICLHLAAKLVRTYDIIESAWWLGNIFDSTMRWCVPVFVMISGALLLDPQKNEPLGIFYRKRLSRVIVPLLFWTAFYVVLTWYEYRSSTNPKPLKSYVAMIIRGQPYYHMWFLYMILGLYLFTPFFRKIVSFLSGRELWQLTVFMLVLAILHGLLGHVVPSGQGAFTGMFLLYIPYFFLGHLIRHDARQPSAALLWFVFAVTSIVTMAGVYLGARYLRRSDGFYFYEYLSVTVVPMSIAMMYLAKTWHRPIVNSNFTRTLGMLTLGVYLMHPVIIKCFVRVGVNTQTLPPAIWLPVMILLVTISSFAACWIVMKLPIARRII